MKALLGIFCALALASASMDAMARGRGGHGGGHGYSHSGGYNSGDYSALSETPAAADEAANENATPKHKASSRYHTGPRGGCYTISASGKKRYVDRSLCR